MVAWLLLFAADSEPTVRQVPPNNALLGLIIFLAHKVILPAAVGEPHSWANRARAPVSSPHDAPLRAFRFLACCFQRDGARLSDIVKFHGNWFFLISPCMAMMVTNFLNDWMCQQSGFLFFL
jgi:hypothetical protein